MLRRSMFLRVAFHSLLYRKNSVILTVLSIAVSVFVLLGVEHIRQQAKTHFSQTVSGVDLIVGARTGELNLLLYSVFRIGNATNNISWQNFLDIAGNKKIAWAIPISLGDSHKGYRVVGTSADYFSRFQYGQSQALLFAQGEPFSELFDVVLGAEVAKKLGYQLNDRLVLAHGIAKTSFSLHDDKPFKVVGILQSTGTPVDNALYVSLQAIEAIHKDWQSGTNLARPAKSTSTKGFSEDDLTPKSITAVLLGLKTKMATFQLQRAINTYPKEPLLAILPGVALAELWQMMGIMENTLRTLSVLIFISALLGLTAMLLASMRERNNELIIMRTIGAPPVFLFMLLILEAMLMVLAGVLIAMLSLSAVIVFVNQFLTHEIGMMLSINYLSTGNLFALAAVFAGAFIVSLVPAFKAYRLGLMSKS